MTAPSSFSSAAPQHQNNNNNNNNNIQELIQYARTNYQENPTESLAALLQAMTLNGGPEAAHAMQQRLETELGPDVANHVSGHHGRMERALQMIEELLQDESTMLYKQGRQDILRQTMQDGSSVVCGRCNDVVASTRWQQHQQYWCRCNASSQNSETEEAICEEDDEQMEMG